MILRLQPHLSAFPLCLSQYRISGLQFSRDNATFLPILVNFVIIKLFPIMETTFYIILFLFYTVFSIKAANVGESDSLDIYYDRLYAVNWTFNVFPVANIYTFPQESIDKVVDAMQSTHQEFLFGGNDMLCYYLDTYPQEAQIIKDNIGKVDLPDGYKWGFGLCEKENQKLTLIVAICELKSPFSEPIKHAFFEKDSFGKPSIGFSLLQSESEEPLKKYRKYRIQHKNNALVIEINGWIFASTQINQLDIPNTKYITISNVPFCILEELYRPPFNPTPVIIVE